MEKSLNDGLHGLRWAVLIVLLAWPGTAVGQVIDLFENQNAMPVETIEGANQGANAEGSGRGDGYSHRMDGGMRLPFFRERGTLFVEARVHGQPYLFVLDTGASGTTLTTAAARALRIEPGPDSPALMVRTASGVMQSRVGIMDRFQLGPQTLRRVSFSICDPCGAIQYRGRPVAGLLGMNVLGRYRLSLDDSRGILELVPNSGFSNQWSDIERWLSVRYAGHRYSSAARREMTVRLFLHNGSPYPITNVEVEMTCQSATGSVQSSRGRVALVRPGAPVEVDVRATISDCEDVQAQIVEARW